ncbi:MAG: DegT/DnrJ/EryC1/StrS family aminotransferase [Methanomicrobiaceae archaeon]|nr:DegT/DnrJ/EryC1/StrS family aminotransferase [Methanomicrobiaceae archaeon]MDD5418455.1 DegT/DnrJ/EryC1/StrS family aminotransferase [Methanomicrobiaceae archaeon]
MLARSRSFIDVEGIADRLSSHDCLDEAHIGEFEAAFSACLGGPRCIATNQGRAALLIGLRSLSISPGDEVIVPGFTYEGVVDAVLEAGASPVLVDPSLEDFNAHAAAIEAKMTERTKAIIATHLFGIPTDIGEIAAIAADRGCYLIEDCAQCLGATYGGRTVGTFGDLAFFSFNYEKHITTGEGGMLAVNNPELIEQVFEVAGACERMPIPAEKNYVYGLLVQYLATERDLYQTSLIAYFGQNCCKKDPGLVSVIDDLIRSRASESTMRETLLPHLRREAARSGMPPFYLRNPILLGVLFRVNRAKTRVIRPTFKRIGSKPLLMNSLRALVGSVGLEHLDAENAIRNRNAAYFYSALRDEGCFILPEIDPRKKPAFLKYNAINNTEYPLSQIASRCNEEGFEIGNVQWPKPIHQIPRFRDLFQTVEDELRTSEYLAERILNIPIHADVTPDDIEGIVSVLRQFIAGVGRGAGRRQNLQESGDLCGAV